MKKVLISTAMVVFGFGSAFSQTWSPVCEAKGHTLIASSDHFEICKKATFDDGTANNVSVSLSDAETALKTLEYIFSVYHDSLKWMLPQPSSANLKCKSVAYIFENSKMGALYGGSNSEACLNGECSPGLWLGNGALSDTWGLAHEYAHGMQGVAGWMGNNSHTGWIAESHANWMAHQVYPTDAHYCSEALINFPYLYYGSTRDRYCNWQFMEHLKEEFGGGYAGAMEFNRIWMESVGDDGTEARMLQTPFTAMMMVYGWSLDSLNKQFGKFAMKNATLEYAPAKKALYQKTWGDYEFETRRATGWGDIYRRHPRVTMMNRLDSANNRYISPSYWAPQRLGYNLVRIYPDSTGKVTVKFRGIVQHEKVVSGYTCFGDNTDYYDKVYHWCNYSPDTIPEAASQWAFGLVAEGSDGSPRYSEMKLDTAGNISIEVQNSDKALWLSVTAAPSKMHTILWDQFYYSIYRYPYMIEVENGKPEGFQENAWVPSSIANYSRHSNGGGWVSNSASVASTVYVGPNAVVNGGNISGNVRMEDFAVVNGGTISGSAVLRGRALVTGGTISDNAILEDDAWLISGKISENAKVGALSMIVNSTIGGSAEIYGVMWAVADKTVNGTAQLRGDLENNFTSTISKGVFYGVVDDGMLSLDNYGANRTEAVPEVTASIENAAWYEIEDDKTSVKDRTPVAEKLSAVKIGETLVVKLPTGSKMLYVTDFRGKVLKSQKVDSRSVNVEIRDFAKGNYILMVKSSEGLHNVRFTR